MQKISTYWKCQLAGWGIVSLFWAYIALTRDHFTIFHTVLNYLGDVFVCIGITHTYRYYYHKSRWVKNDLSIFQLLWKILPHVLIMAVLFMLLMNLKASLYVYWVLHENNFLSNLTVWNPVLITGLRHMAIWVLAYQLYHFYLREVSVKLRNAQLVSAAKQAEIDHLAAQLNPHFLFNSMNSIKSLVIENPEKARRAIDLLSDILRSSLLEKDQALIPVEKELQLVQDYIELEKIRLEERLHCHISDVETAHGFKVPALALQLLVENAIKHGIGSSPEGGVVQITIQKDIKFATINVTNPGSLNITESGNGIGLKNLKQRLKLQYNHLASLEIKNTPENTVTATLIIPITDENI